MLKRLVVFAFVLFAVVFAVPSVFAQSGVVTEARTNLEKEHHEALVKKAQDFLAEKARLEARLKIVESKLSRLDAGENVKDDSEAGEPSAVSMATGAVVYTPGCCSTTAGWVYCRQ